MTDEMNDPRAEQAFRTALNQRADALETVPLDAGPVPRRRRWLPGAVAAAVLILVGGTALAAGVLGGGGNGDTAVKDKVATGALPVADDGWRWVSWRDVGVQVPAGWADGFEPGSDWCADTGVERQLPPDPYVARNGAAGVVLAIGCQAPEDGRPEIFGAAPQDHWAPHLTFADATDATDAPLDGETQFDGWTVMATTIDSVQLRLWADSETAELADRILGSARTFTTDANGCDVTSPVQSEEFVRPQPGFDVSQVDDVDSISVCQYDRHLGDRAVALMASQRLEGPAAAGLLAGIKSAATGGGPDRPENCAADMYGDHAIALRFQRDGTTDDAYVYYDWCFGNGIDDGTTRYELSADNCAPMFGDGVIAWTFSSFLLGRCG